MVDPMHFCCHCSVTRFTVWDDAGPHHTLILILFAMLCTSFQRCWAQPSKAPAPRVDDLAGAYYYPWYAAPAQSERGWMRQLFGGDSHRVSCLRWVSTVAEIRSSGSHRTKSTSRAGFWAVSWWPGKREDRALQDHILKHPQAESLQYAILYESTGRLGSFEQPNYDSLIPDFEYLNQHLFSHPQYLRIQGKPVVFLYLTRVYFRNRGQEALAALRSRFSKN